MRALGCVLSLLAMLAGCGERTGDPPAQAPANPAREISIDTLSGDRLSREQLRGRWLLVNYWAEWCKPCAEEIPELNRFARLHAGEVVVLGVNYDGATGEELRRQAQKLNLDFAVATEDPAGMLGLPRPRVLPTTHVLDRNGRLYKTLVGPQTSSRLAAALGE